MKTPGMSVLSAVFVAARSSAPRPGGLEGRWPLRSVSGRPPQRAGTPPGALGDRRAAVGSGDVGQREVAGLVGRAHERLAVDAEPVRVADRTLLAAPEAVHDLEPVLHRAYLARGRSNVQEMRA